MKGAANSLFRLCWVCASVPLILAGCSSGSQAVPSKSMSAPAAAFESGERTPSTKPPVWSVISSPNEPPGSSGVYDDVFNGAGGTSPSDVWAVGDYCCFTHGSQDYYHALIEHWNGSAWTIIPYPEDEPADTYLHAVAAVSKSDAWAVGNAPFPNNQAVFEHWNGKKWRIVPSPYIYNGGDMYSVVAISRNNAWAAGVGNFSAVLEHWDGTRWSFVPAYNQGVTVLQSISASGPNDIWAVGEFLDPIVGVFAEHFDGSKWTYESPFNDFFASAFSSVTVVSPNDAWAVGYEEPSQQSEVPQTLIEHWTGTHWALVHSPNKDPKGSYNLYNVLSGVAARSPRDIWAVGGWTWYPGSGTTRSLFEHWDGEAWKVKPGPPPLETSNDAAINQLLGIAKVGSGQLWAVGDQVIPPAPGFETLTVETLL